MKPENVRDAETKPIRLKTDTREWSSGRVKFSLIGIPDKPETYYILFEKDFFGRTSNAPQRFILRERDWQNLKRFIDGPQAQGGWADSTKWKPSIDEKALADLISRQPDLLETVLGSSNLGKFSDKSLEALDRLGARLFEIKAESIDKIFERLVESSTQTIQTFAALLSDLRLDQISLLSNLIYRKLRTLDLLERVIVEISSKEAIVHEIFDQNPWLLGKNYEVVQSDAPLAQFLSTNLKDDPETRKRPDLLIKRVPYSDDIVVVELKAPGVKLKADHIGQVLRYKALIKKNKPNVRNIDCFLYGYEKSDTFTESNDVAIKTFSELVAELRDEYSEYLKALELGKEEPAPSELDGAF